MLLWPHGAMKYRATDLADNTHTHKIGEGRLCLKLSPQVV